MTRTRSMRRRMSSSSSTTSDFSALVSGTAPRCGSAAGDGFWTSLIDDLDGVEISLQFIHEPSDFNEIFFLGGGFNGMAEFGNHGEPVSSTISPHSVPERADRVEIVHLGRSMQLGDVLSSVLQKSWNEILKVRIHDHLDFLTIFSLGHHTSLLACSAIAANNVAFRMGFVKCAVQPAARLLASSSFIPNAVRARTGTLCRPRPHSHRRMACVALYPSIMGIC